MGLGDFFKDKFGKKACDHVQLQTGSCKTDHKNLC